MINPSGESDVDNWPTSELAWLADKIRAPFLPLSYFLDDPDDVPDEPGDEEELELLAAGVSGERVYQARLRRAGLLWASHRVIDRCTEDLLLQNWDPQTQLLRWDEDSAVEEPFLWDYFPDRYRHAYTREFLTKVLVSAVKVSYDLARPDSHHAACMAEELILNAICCMAEVAWDMAQLGPPCMDVEELLLEDSDFKVLFDEAMDGIENDTATQLDQRMTVPGIQGWFTPFNDVRIVHPYCETDWVPPKANDLLHLLAPDEHDQLRDPRIVDNPAPLTGLQALSDAVQQARDTQEPWREGVWVPDPHRAEQSYADLLTLIGDHAVSGWLTWAPDERADQIRTQPVIEFLPHRHFPAATDQPWAEVAATSTVTYIPLSAIVAFRLDPAIRRRWEQTCNELLGLNKPQE